MRQDKWTLDDSGSLLLLFPSATRYWTASITHLAAVSVLLRWPSADDVQLSSTWTYSKDKRKIFFDKKNSFPSTERTIVVFSLKSPSTRASYPIELTKKSDKISKRTDETYLGRMTS